MSATIIATCIVYPNGDTFWTDSQDASEIGKLVEAWKREHPDYIGVHVYGGFVQVRMFKRDYLQLSNRTPTP